jgi:DNA-directed RNA polymerase subunit M/transcription elongation factor TFIIS
MLRQNVVNLIKKKTDLDDIHSKDFEIGIFNWCIQFAEDHNIAKNWANPKFKNIYIEKTRSCVSNIDKNSYIGNIRLLDRLNEEEFLPHDVAFMKYEHVFPEKWNDTLDAYTKKIESAYEYKIMPMTTMFLCTKCKKRECSYTELQTRSGDESSTIYVRCCNCGNSWKI